jgi:hypothetical protein
MTLSMVSSVIQTLVGEEFASGHDLTTQVLVPLLRILILVATFLLANCTFNKKNNQKRTSPYNQATRSLLMQSHVMKASSKKTNGFKGKRPFNLPCEDEDALSTSVGSSDSESDLTSSDQEDIKGTKISISELLRCRPSAGAPPPGCLKTMPVGSPVQQRPSWAAARGTSSAPHPQAAVKASSKMATSKAAKAAPKEMATSKAAKAPYKTPPAPVKSKGAPVSINPSGVAEAKPERIQALLAIICPEAESPQQTNKTFPPGLEPSPAVL